MPPATTLPAVQRIADLLRAHPGERYTVQALADATGFAVKTVSGTLSRVRRANPEIQHISGGQGTAGVWYWQEASARRWA